MHKTDITYKNSADILSLFTPAGSCHATSYGPYNISLRWYEENEAFGEPPIVQELAERLPLTHNLSQFTY